MSPMSPMSPSQRRRRRSAAAEFPGHDKGMPKSKAAIGDEPVESKPYLVGFGIAIFLVVFMLSWFDGLTQSQALCKDGVSCSAFDIMITMVLAFMQMWAIVIVLVIILFAIEVVLVGIITKPLGKGDGPMSSVSAITDPIQGVVKTIVPSLLALKVMFSWLLNPVTFLGIAAAFAATFAFTGVYVIWLDLRDASKAEYQQVIYNVYIFYLIAMLSMVVSQFVLHEWWKQP